MQDRFVALDRVPWLEIGSNEDEAPARFPRAGRRFRKAREQACWEKEESS